MWYGDGTCLLHVLKMSMVTLLCIPTLTGANNTEFPFFLSKLPFYILRWKFVSQEPEGHLISLVFHQMFRHEFTNSQCP